MKPIDQIAYWAVIRTDMKAFLQQAFITANSDKVFMDNWHIDSIVHHLELSISGKLPRLIINLPPRYLKSFIVSVVLPAFVLGRDPTAKIICVSYSDELAKALARDFRRIVESEWYPRVFPEVKVSKMTEIELVTTEGGGRYATSVGGSLTGRGGDVIIIDDPLKAGDAQSDKLRQAANEWIRDTLFSRLDDKMRGSLIFVMQRLHVNDPTGVVEGNNFHKLSLPAISTKDEAIAVDNGKTYFRKAGEALHEKYESLDILHQIRNDIGSYNFAAQYQQAPDSPKGAIFERKWINFISKLPPRPGGRETTCISIDTAVSTSETADYSVISIIYSNKTGHYVLDVERGHWDYETLKAKALFYGKRYQRATYIVEAVGVGESLAMYLNGKRFNCFHYRPKINKESRARLVVPMIEAGRLFILNREGQNKWVESYINEMLSFPNGRFDDQVDSLVQTLLWAEPRVNPGGRYVEAA